MHITNTGVNSPSISPKGPRKNNAVILAADPSRRPALLVAHIPRVCRAPRALAAGRLDTQDDRVILARALTVSTSSSTAMIRPRRRPVSTSPRSPTASRVSCFA